MLYSFLMFILTFEFALILDVQNPNLPFCTMRQPLGFYSCLMGNFSHSTVHFYLFNCYLSPQYPLLTPSLIQLSRDLR